MRTSYCARRSIQDSPKVRSAITTPTPQQRWYVARQRPTLIPEQPLIASRRNLHCPHAIGYLAASCIQDERRFSLMPHPRCPPNTKHPSPRAYQPRQRFTLLLRHITSARATYIAVERGSRARTITTKAEGGRPYGSTSQPHPKRRRMPSSLSSPPELPPPSTPQTQSSFDSRTQRQAQERRTSPQNEAAKRGHECST